MREKKNEKPKIFSSIHRVPPVGIHRAKNESSSTRRGLRVSTKNMGFRRGLLGGSYLRKRIDPAVVSLDNRRTISRGKG